jgi:hypothetical protein
MSHAKTENTDVAQLAAQIASGGITPELFELLTKAAATADATNTVRDGKDVTTGAYLIRTLKAQLEAHHQDNDEKATPREPASRGR